MAISCATNRPFELLFPFSRLELLDFPDLSSLVRRECFRLLSRLLSFDLHAIFYWAHRSPNDSKLVLWFFGLINAHVFH